MEKGDGTQPEFMIPHPFFEMLGPSKSADNIRFKCLMCGGDKSISANKRSKLNLRNHISSKHSDILATYDDWCHANDRRRKRNRQCADVDNSVYVQVVNKAKRDIQSAKRVVQPAKTVVQPSTSSLSTELQATYSRKLTQAMLDKYVLEYITDSVLPFSHVESTAFKSLVANLLGGASKQVLINSQDAYRSQMKDLFLYQKQLVIDSMENADVVCLTANQWSQRGDGFLGITAHWFEKGQNTTPIRKYACIALKRIRGTCSPGVLGTQLRFVMAEYGLQYKVSHCVTDSGSNFPAAFKDFTQLGSSYTTTTNQDSVNNAPGNQDQMVAEPVLFLDGDEGGMESFDLPLHFRCVARRLNLVATGLAASEALNHQSCNTVCRSLMAKMSDVWDNQSCNELVADRIQGKLITPNAAKWNSTFNALSRVQELLNSNRNEFQSFLASKSIQPVTQNEEVFLAEFLRILRPLASALEIIQGSPEAGYLLPTLYVVKDEWMDIENGDLKYCTEFLSALHADLNIQFQEEFESEFFQIAAALHPKFKLNWMTDPEKRSNIRHIVRVTLPDTDNDSYSQGYMNEAQASRSAMEQSFFKRLKSKSMKKNLFDQWASWADSDDESVPAFLRKAFIAYNTTMPCSASVDLDGRLLTTTGALMSDEDFEMCVILGGNRSLGLE